MTFGLSGIIPAIHFGVVEGWFTHVSQKSLGWLILMGVSTHKFQNDKNFNFTNFLGSIHSGRNVVRSTSTGKMVPRKI